MNAPTPCAFELPLPWGPVVRGHRWAGGPDRVLLLHEPGTDLDAWGTLPEKIARALNVEVVAVDLPGHGLSDDPWEAERIGDLIRSLLPRQTRFPPPHSICAQEIGDSSRTFFVASGRIGLAALELAGDLELAGLVCLSPGDTKQALLVDSSAIPPSPIANGESVRGVRVAPKLIFASSMSADDLVFARRLASHSRGWAVVTSIPVAVRGTALLKTHWETRIAEEIIAFLRDCQRRPTTRSRLPVPARPPVPR